MSRLVLFAACLSLLLLLSNVYVHPVTPRPVWSTGRAHTSARPEESPAAMAPVAPVVAATWRLRDHAGADDCPLPPDAVGEISRTGSVEFRTGSETWRSRARARTSTRYLAFQPQGGLSNQLVGLAHAAAWALVLDRTLVLPHLLPHQDLRAAGRNDSLSYDGQQASLELSALPPFESVFAPTAVAGLRTISVGEMLRRGVRPSAVVQLPEIEATRRDRGR